MAASLHAILIRVILVLFGLCLALPIAEGALRIVALFVGRDLGEPSPSLGKWRMLCLGDSNTYGMYVDNSQAYPKVFERIWNANMNRPVEVLNLGYPGTNSSKLVKDFRRMLWTFRPDVVTVMIGGNDRWTVPETAAESPNRIDRLTAALWRVSRVYRLLYMVRRAFQIRQLEITQDPTEGFQHGHATARYGSAEFELGWTKIPQGGTGIPRPTVELKENLETLAAQAAEFGTRLVLLTYAADSSFYMWANGVVRDTAKSTGIPLIDVAAVLKPNCPVPADSTILTGPGAQCPELLPDQHPSVLGHERVPQILAQQLLPTLGQSR